MGIDTSNGISSISINNLGNTPLSISITTEPQTNRPSYGNDSFQNGGAGAAYGALGGLYGGGGDPVGRLFDKGSLFNGNNSRASNVGNEPLSPQSLLSPDGPLARLLGPRGLAKLQRKSAGVPNPEAGQQRIDKTLDQFEMLNKNKGSLKDYQKLLDRTTNFGNQWEKRLDKVLNNPNLSEEERDMQVQKINKILGQNDALKTSLTEVVDKWPDKSEESQLGPI